MKKNKEIEEKWIKATMVETGVVEAKERANWPSLSVYPSIG